jgi:5-deoxy-glucuronate isomerase
VRQAVSPRAAPADRYRGRLLRRAGPPDAEGTILGVSAADAGWSYVGFSAHRLTAGAVIRRPSADEERLILVLEGRATVRVSSETFAEVGGRDSVFDGPPAPVILAAPQTELEVRAETTALIGLATAPAGPIERTALIPGDEILVESRGSGNTARQIHHLLPPAAEAGRLIAFEVFTPGGNWSSYPPHKHDTEDPPREAYLEELYYYRFARPQGYALQRVYTADRTVDEVMAPMDGDAVLVPAGYHPVGAPAGYDCYYLNVMAGPNRAWHFTVDPDHAWLMDWDAAAPQSG